MSHPSRSNLNPIPSCHSKGFIRMYWASKGQLNTCIFGEYPSVFPEKNCNKEQHYKTAAVFFFFSYKTNFTNYDVPHAHFDT